MLGVRWQLGLVCVAELLVPAGISKACVQGLADISEGVVSRVRVCWGQQS